MSTNTCTNPITISLTLNSKPLSIAVDPAERLLDTLRYQLGLTGTKEGCAEGECGACTVLIDDQPANACLVLTCQLAGRFVRTIESINVDTLHHMHEQGTTQCGACTPGVVMCAQWINEHQDVLKHQSLRQLMSGNLCRCTGYDGIILGIEKTLNETNPATAHKDPR